MAACQTQTVQLNSNSTVNTNANQASGPSATLQPNLPSQQINSAHVGLKRKGSDFKNNVTPLKQKPTWLQQQLPEQNKQELFCEICLVQLNSVSQALQHKQGRVHLNKVKKVEEFRTVSLPRILSELPNVYLHLWTFKFTSTCYLV